MSDVDRDIFDAEEFGVQIERLELRKHLVEIFPDETGGYLKQAHVALEENDASRLHQAAHGLKGVVGNYLGTRAYVAATELDRLARTGDLDAASEALTMCELEVNSLGAALHGFLAGEKV